MAVWLQRGQNIDSAMMREIADTADVSWDYQSILYQGRGIGYCDGVEDDLEAIQDAAEDLLGYRPQPYDPPSDDT